MIFEFDDDRTGLFDGNRLNDHVADNPRRTMGEMWLEGERGVLRLDGQARLWWKPHQGTEAEHPYPARCAGCLRRRLHRAAGPCAGPPAPGRAAGEQRRDYLANLQVQAAVYHSHTTGRVVPDGAVRPLTDNPDQENDMKKLSR
jgi:hypothetical protein